MLNGLARDDGVETIIFVSNCLDIHHLPVNSGKIPLRGEETPLLHRSSGEVGGYYPGRGGMLGGKPASESSPTATNFEHSLGGQISGYG
jgi:hypothetical protein